MLIVFMKVVGFSHYLPCMIVYMQKIVNFCWVHMPQCHLLVRPSDKMKKLHYDYDIKKKITQIVSSKLLFRVLKV